MFIIKFKDGTQAIVHNILSHDNYCAIWFLLGGSSVKKWLVDIDKIVRYFPN